MEKVLQERKKFFQNNRFETKSGIEAVFVTVLENNQPAPLIFMIGGYMENYYLNGMHMPYPTDLDLQTDYYAVEDEFFDDDDEYDDFENEDEDNDELTLQQTIL
jgi:hypothetical protein